MYSSQFVFKYQMKNNVVRPLACFSNKAKKKKKLKGKCNMERRKKGKRKY